ncbi:MAG TPA: hypothetical protein VMK12_32470 [Anaeromyxobacteraceae bacterium]|nr:hypothetical protein [Anaeromyxobacteraceae bacterium]
MTPAELIERGIRAYTRGEVGEAERLWRDVLAMDPDNTRARSFLELLGGWLVAAKAMPVPLPAPSGSFQPAPVAVGPTSVPLPSPDSSWLSSPTTISLGAHPDAALRDISAPPQPAGASSHEGPSGDVATPSSAGTRAKGGQGSQASSMSAEDRPSAPGLGDYAPSPWDLGPARTPAIVLSEGPGLDLVSVAEQSGVRTLVPDTGGSPEAAAKPCSEIEIWMQGARELFALGDFSGSLAMIEKILKVEPMHGEAREYLQQNEATLIAMYESKLGSIGLIPRLALKPEEILWLNLDHRAGFLLAQIDGVVSYEDLFALSGLPRLDTARILASLLEEGVVTS